MSFPKLNQQVQIWSTFNKLLFSKSKKCISIFKYYQHIQIYLYSSTTTNTSKNPKEQLKHPYGAHFNQIFGVFKFRDIFLLNRY